MKLADNEIHCHIWPDLGREQLRSAKLIPRTLELYPEVTGVIRQTDKGKPYLANSCCQVSVAHSGRRAVVVLTRSSLIGCDIESFKERKFTRISQSYFHENEAAAIDNAVCRMPMFYGLWTLKEAYGKAIGTGISSTLGRDFSHVIQNMSWNSTVTEQESIRLIHIRNIPGYGFYRGIITPGCAIAIAVQTCSPIWTFKCVSHRSNSAT